mgnify:CR=1 FL=1
MEETIFKSTLENKYISIIENHIDKSDTNIILSGHIYNKKLYFFLLK